MQNAQSKGMKQIYPGKFLFHLNSKDIYYLTLDATESNNIEILLIKLQPRQTYVYKSQIPFQSLNMKENSVYDALKDLNFFIYNLKFSLTEEFNKIILLINNQTRIEVGLYNKNMDDKWKNEQNLEAKKSMDKLREKMNSLLNIVSMQQNKIAELKQREESQVNLINKIEEVTKKINEQYQQQIQNNNNMPQNNNNTNNNINNNYPNNNNNYNNDKRKNLFLTTNPNLQGKYPVANNLNSMNMNNKKNPKLNMTVNVKFKPYLPENADVNNLLTRPQYSNPYPQNKPTHMQMKSINLDNIPDYRHSNSNY
jgi:hypothetical protein